MELTPEQLLRYNVSHAKQPEEATGRSTLRVRLQRRLPRARIPKPRPYRNYASIPFDLSTEMIRALVNRLRIFVHGEIMILQQYRRLRFGRALMFLWMYDIPGPENYF